MWRDDFESRFASLFDRETALLNEMHSSDRFKHAYRDACHATCLRWIRQVALAFLSFCGITVTALNGHCPAAFGGIQIEAKTGFSDNCHCRIGNATPDIEGLSAVDHSLRDFDLRPTSKFVALNRQCWRCDAIPRCIGGLRRIWPDNAGFVGSIHSKTHVLLAKRCFGDIKLSIYDRHISVFNFPIEAQSRTFPDVSEQEHITNRLTYYVSLLFVVPDSSWSKPSPIGVYDSLVSVDYAKVHKTETDQAYDRRSARNYIKAFGYPNLSFPYAPLGGAVAIFIGVLLSNRGIERGPLIIWLCGWLIMVGGGVVCLLSALPLLVLGF